MAEWLVGRSADNADKWLTVSKTDNTGIISPVARVFLLDDHELIRRAPQLIEAEVDLELAGEASSVRESLSLIPASSPDVVVVDYRLSDGEGIEVCRELRSQHPEIRFLILTSFEDEEVVMKAVMAGADGFLVKSSGDAILEAIRTVAAGRSLFDPA